MVEESQTSADNESSIELEILTKQELAKAYMPYIKNGGLFIRAKHLPELGDTIALKLILIDEPTAFQVTGKVIWLTPLHAQGQRAPGFGIQFTSENAQEICDKIETYLAGMLDSIHSTDTM